MANSSIVKYAILGAGVYLAWQGGLFSKLLASINPAGAAPGGGAPPPTTTTGGGSSTATAPPKDTPPPPYAYTPPTTRAALLKAVAGNAFYMQQGSKFNADQWKYYYDQLPGKQGALDPFFEQLFYPSGRPPNASDYPLFTVDDFIAAITTKGLSGLAAIAPAPMAALIHRAAAGDLIAAVQLTKMGVKVPVAGRQLTPADLLRARAKSSLHGVSLGGLPVEAFRV